MKNIAIILSVILVLLCPGSAPSQTQLVGRDFFPADLEFRELESIRSTTQFQGTERMKTVADGDVLTEAGAQRYAARVYAVPGGTLSIEVVAMKDAKAAYSVLTLLRKTSAAAGPPGDWFAPSENETQFARGNFWVRIRGNGDPDLARRVATSVSNRIGEREPAAVSMISNLSPDGCDTSSLRYFLGPLGFKGFGRPIAGGALQFKPDMEAAQVGYAIGDRHGLLTLVSLPTTPLAEEYFDQIAASLATAPRLGEKVYTRRAGPVLAFLEGNFDPQSADQILESVQYTYSIKWIYDKKNRGSGTVLGIPMGILGTVVRSLVLTALICGASLLLGVGLALFRVFIRGYAPNNFLDRPERTEIIRLKIDEN
jgi:hypothetical protein